MSAGYQIKDIAERSGFSPATLRYYEEIGLLPAPARTLGGYRRYDDTTLQRLAFIGRAKQLGCTLDEVADLLVAWNGGRCGPVQDQLRRVVAGKIAAAQGRVVEMIALTSDLQRAAAALERHRPDGPCDPRCGCVTDSTAHSETAATGVPLIAEPGRDPGTVPIACTLGVDSLHGRVEEWRALLAHVDRREPIDGGVRAVFDTTVPVDELMRLTAAEHDCCQFFSFAITVDARGIALEITAPSDARAMLQSLFGAA